MGGRGAAIAELDCEKVTVSPGSAEVLESLDFRAASGSRTVIVGPSGAGKTTLLRAICGLERLDSGKIELGGRRIDHLPAHERRCSVVFQEPRLLAHLDLLDNVALGLMARKVPKKSRRARAGQMLDEVGLGDLAAGGVRGLSGGEQQRVALARALCADPEILLLDEPMSAVDPNRRDSLMKLILSLHNARPVTLVSVTHDRGEDAEMGQEIAVLIDGKMLPSDDPEAVFERPQSEAAARFFGLNLIRGTVRRGRLEFAGSVIPVDGPDGAAAIAFRPESVLLSETGGIGMTVVEAVYLGTHVRLRLGRGSESFEARVPAAGAPAAGAAVGVQLPRSGLWRIPT